MAKPLQEIHGLSRVIRVAMREDAETGQEVWITDDGAYVRLSISTCSYPAKLTPAEARYLAQQLMNGAARAENAEAGASEA